MTTIALAYLAIVVSCVCIRERAKRLNRLGEPIYNMSQKDYFQCRGGMVKAEKRTQAGTES